jgi:hypothetical protein
MRPAIQGRAFSRIEVQTAETIVRRAHGALNPWFAVEFGSWRSHPDGPRGTASSSRGSPPATSVNCRCRLGGKPNPQQPYADDIRAVVAAGNPQMYKRSAPDESAKRKRNNGKICKAAEPFPQSGAIPFQSEMCRNALETGCRVFTASSPTGGVSPDSLGGRAAPRIPPAKTPLLVHLRPFWICVAWVAAPVTCAPASASLSITYQAVGWNRSGPVWQACSRVRTRQPLGLQ